MKYMLSVVVASILVSTVSLAASIGIYSPLYSQLTAIPAGINTGVYATGIAASTLNVSWTSVSVSDGASGLILGSFAGSANPATAGPAVNGRDQAGAFATNTWIYCYGISKADGSSPGLLLSQSSSTPTLPATYTRKTLPLTAFYTGGGTGISQTFYWAANTAFYNTAQTLVSGGTAATFAAGGINTGGVVPPQANRIGILGAMTGNTVNNSVTFSYDGSLSLGSYIGLQVSGVAGRSGSSFLPCNGQLFYYAVSGGGTNAANVNCIGWGWTFSP